MFIYFVSSTVVCRIKIKEDAKQIKKETKEMKLDANLQPSMPEIDANLIGKKIQVNFEMDVIDELGEVTQKKHCVGLLEKYLK